MKGRKEPKSSTATVSLTKSFSVASTSIVKKSLKAPFGIMSYSLSTMSKNTPRGEDAEQVLESGESESSSGDKEEDLASPNVMAKSIAGLLTTASMYVGIGDIQQAEQMGDEDVKGESDDESAKQAEVSGGSDTKDAEAEKFTETTDDMGTSMTGTHSATDSRRSTLFELSIVPNHDTHSIHTTKSRNRASKIMSKLKSKFNLDDDEQLTKEYSCWLLKNVLIQGHIYLTSKNLLFFAFLYKSNGSAKLTGSLSIYNNSISISGKPTRYWAVLKDHTLSLYNSSTDLYFPVLTIDLRYVTKVQQCKKNGQETKEFYIVTENKTYSFYADNGHSARSWASSLKKQVFTTQNSENDSISIKIPLCNIVDLEDQIIVEQGLTLRVRVMESYDSFALDDYFFMFFNNSANQLKEIIRVQLLNLEMLGSQVMINYKRASSPVDTSRTGSPVKNMVKDWPRGRGSERTESYSTHLLLGMLSSPTRRDEGNLTKSQTSPRTPSRVKQTFKSMTDSLKLSSPRLLRAEEPSSPERQRRTDDPIPISFTQANEGSSLDQSSDVLRSKLSYWNPKSLNRLRNMWNAQPVHYATHEVNLFSKDDGLTITDRSELQAADKRFKNHFSLTNEETLIASYYTYLNRSVPLYGKIYLGKNVMCFRSLIPGFKTKMILPLADVENCYKENGFRFGYFGLVVVIHGYEELFFEFASQKSRDDAEFVILKIIDAFAPIEDIERDASGRQQAVGASNLQDATNDAKLRLFEDKISSVGYDIPIMVEDSPYYKTKITPKKFYTFGLLTIGSRGDVQPYIALGKGLVEEGHKVVIITHKEFGDWVTSYGLWFRSIAGDPAELMALMVQHGSMNVGLIRESATRFKDWKRDLLTTAWDACQGLDVLIESPSAMAGIHIAEALQIPYFRAFTMPWTKTRSYPHAFIVPDQRRGGNYNYFTHILFENIFWRGISAQVNKWRVETLGLKKTNLEFLQQSKVPFIYNMSPKVFPPSVDFAEWIKVTGYWFLNEGSNYSPPKELADFIKKSRESGKPLVYIGFGSIVVKDPAKMTMAVVEAVVKAEVCCILNKGWSERLGSPSQRKIDIELPDCVYNAGNVPHDWLFPQMDAVVHHGGSGTTGASMRAGVPTVIKPFFWRPVFLRQQD
ncbi:sterol 3-beta-glucosyltransferase Ecym_1074 [Eremothecium cymbalariae DBVPG|uniref:Sterol 3-beta-glucosyltransferase n=1 Tax=Eremothecium cymbalariae (strain CBS 270.75 / DBVPG 7215 / KCTC 17166 / NRRL Y-17582) TaxID=931890 RepID=G8JMC3_ERECY|nr:hypothetical protein Ecym_1074 [Eremothecium cymbalariae DBVPG\